MPDGDIVHSRINGFYCNPYRILCEQSADQEVYTRELLMALKKDLQRKGDQPIALASELANLLSNQLGPDRFNKSVNWGELNKKVDQLINQSDMPHYLRDLMIRSVRDVVHDFRYQERLCDFSIHFMILKRYITNIYEFRFASRIPSTRNHNNDVTTEFLTRRVNSMRPKIDSTIDRWISNIIATQTIKKIRMPKRSTRKSIDLEENLL